MAACDNWSLQFNPDEISYQWRVAFVDAWLIAPRLPPPAQGVSVAVSDFRPAGIVKQLAWDVDFAHRCHTYRLGKDGPVTVTVAVVHGLGQQELLFQLYNASRFAGQYVKTHIRLLLVREHGTLIGISQAGNDNDVRGDPVMSRSEFRSIGSWLVKGVVRLESSGND